jgi:LacI family transcriptional regulator
MVLSEACHAVGLEIPDQIAVLGVDNDELLCTLSRPPLSSVDIAADRVGYQAAEMLDRLMAGQSDAAVDVLLPPGEVVERQSTNVLQVADADIAMALRFIRNNAHRPLHIDDVTHHVVMPRRTLQRRFREAIGHSFSQEVERCRLELAKRLLAETDLPVPQVARRCGYRDRERLWGAFRRLAGSSPFEYRRQFRQGMD